MDRHLAWILPLVLSVLMGIFWVAHNTIDAGPERIRKMEIELESLDRTLSRIEKYCCGEINR